MFTVLTHYAISVPKQISIHFLAEALLHIVRLYIYLACICDYINEDIWQSLLPKHLFSLYLGID